jgi:hypothetical protein
MMTGLHTRALTSSPFLEANSHPRSTPEGDEGPEFVDVLRDPYEWKSALGFASALFVASLTLAPATTQDRKKLASEINTKTLKAAAAINSSPRLPFRVQSSREHEQRGGAENTRPKVSRFAKLRFS